MELGIGVGWCEEEFTLMGQRFDRRGKRTDEMLELMKELWKPGWTEFDGEFYQTPRLEMEPTPPHIPIYVGGLSDIALRRAARHDGWIGDLITTDRALERVDRLRELRAGQGLVDGRLHRHHAADRCVHPGALRPRAEAGGIDGIVTMPWMFYAGPQATLAEKIDGMKRVPQGLGARLAATEPTQQAAARRRRGSTGDQTPPAVAPVRPTPTRRRASTAQAPAPVVASSRNAKQNRTASSPPLAIGQKLAPARRP